MEEKRKFQRFLVELDAKLVGTGSNAHSRCKVIEISQNGLAIKSDLKNKPSGGPNILLEIDHPFGEKPVNALVKLKWRRQTTFSFKAGGKLKIIKTMEKKRLMDYTYKNLIRSLTAPGDTAPQNPL